MATTPLDFDDTDRPYVGTPMQRREDHRLITGDAEYTDDLQHPHQLHLAIHRSQYGHASISNIDTSAARAIDGVVAVYTHEDLEAAGIENALTGDDPEFGVTAKRPILAAKKARYQGDPIAAVVAEDRYTAAEAADAITVEYDRLDAVGDVSDAVRDDAPQIHDHAPGNIAYEWSGGDEEATNEAFDAADRIVEVDLDINKVIAVPMEPRGAVATYRDGHLDLAVSCQHVISIQDDVSSILGIPEHKVRVRAPDVGGGFGVKIHSYTGHILAAWCAMQHDEPVKWIATRTEAFQSTNHSRRHHLSARIALDKTARIVGLHITDLADVGGYLNPLGSKVTGSNVGTRILGAYDIPHAHVEITGVFTNTVPLSAYRGAGRPEATYTIERIANACARELDIDPVEFRRRNFIDPADFPYQTVFESATYDSGDYEKTLDKALDIVDYEAFRERQRTAREHGRYLGIGFSSYIEICGGSAGSVQGGHVRVLPSGTVVAASSMVENGQGHQTSYAQVVADELGVSYEDVEIIEGDTDRVPEGAGTGGSKALALGGSALKESAANVREQARQIAAHLLEATPDDIDFDDGEFHVAGAPQRSISLKELAADAYSSDLPEVLRGLDDTTFFSPEGSTAPFGTHIAIVEVDPETGEITIDRYVAVDDVGNQINPTLLRGQIVGGVAQSIGQAYFEDAQYDENANLVSGSLQDYAVPKAFDIPEIEWDSTITPSPNNPLGVKGVGEAGTIGAMPALVNAVIDALEPFGVDAIDMPLTGETVWNAIQHDHA